MKTETGSEKQEVRNRMSNAVRRKIGCLILLLGACFWLPSCSIPNLESRECSEARLAVKGFYSYHFGNEMKFSKENLQRRAKFLTGELQQNLAAQPEGETDYFTRTSDYPKAFRVGGCEPAGENQTFFQVVLFWRDDTRNEQRQIKVETVRQAGEWLINKVEN